MPYLSNVLEVSLDNFDQIVYGQDDGFGSLSREFWAVLLAVIICGSTMLWCCHWIVLTLLSAGFSAPAVWASSAYGQIDSVIWALIDPLLSAVYCVDVGFGAWAGAVDLIRSIFFASCIGAIHGWLGLALGVLIGTLRAWWSGSHWGPGSPSWKIAYRETSGGPVRLSMTATVAFLVWIAHACNFVAEHSLHHGFAAAIGIVLASVAMIMCTFVIVWIIERIANELVSDALSLDRDSVRALTAGAILVAGCVVVCSAVDVAAGTITGALLCALCAFVHHLYRLLYNERYIGTNSNPLTIPANAGHHGQILNIHGILQFVFAVATALIMLQNASVIQTTLPNHSHPKWHHGNNSLFDSYYQSQQVWRQHSATLEFARANKNANGTVVVFDHPAAAKDRAPPSIAVWEMHCSDNATGLLAQKTLHSVAITFTPTTPIDGDNDARNRQLTVSGACPKQADLNSVYTLQGTTSTDDGKKECFANDKGVFLYYGGEQPHWMFVARSSISIKSNTSNKFLSIEAKGDSTADVKGKLASTDNTAKLSFLSILSWIVFVILAFMWFFKDDNGEHLAFVYAFIWASVIMDWFGILDMRNGGTATAAMLVRRAAIVFQGLCCSKDGALTKKWGKYRFREKCNVFEDRTLIDEWNLIIVGLGCMLYTVSYLTCEASIVGTFVRWLFSASLFSAVSVFGGVAAVYGSYALPQTSTWWLRKASVMIYRAGLVLSIWTIVQMCNAAVASRNGGWIRDDMSMVTLFASANATNETESAPNGTATDNTTWYNSTSWQTIMWPDTWSINGHVLASPEDAYPTWWFECIVLIMMQDAQVLATAYCLANVGIFGAITVSMVIIACAIIYSHGLFHLFRLIWLALALPITAVGMKGIWSNNFPNHHANTPRHELRADRMDRWMAAMLMGAVNFIFRVPMSLLIFFIDAEVHGKRISAVSPYWGAMQHAAVDLFGRAVQRVLGPDWIVAADAQGGGVHVRYVHTVIAAHETDDGTRTRQRLGIHNFYNNTGVTATTLVTDAPGPRWQNGRDAENRVVTRFDKWKTLFIPEDIHRFTFLWMFDFNGPEPRNPTACRVMLVAPVCALLLKSGHSPLLLAWLAVVYRSKPAASAHAHAD